MDIEKLFISDGISDGKQWGTFERKPNGSLRRIKSKYLPMRPTKEKAKADLAAYLRGIIGVPGSKMSILVGQAEKTLSRLEAE